VDLGLREKRALVIGGSSGIGYAVCEALAAEGAHIIMLARDPARLDESAGRLRRSHGADVITITADMLSRSRMKALADELRSSGGLDVMVLNSARPPSPMREFLAETESERWAEGYEQQLLAPIHAMLELVPLLLEREWSRLIAITSATVKQPMPVHAISTIFRAGVQAALKHLSNENAHRGLTVNAVAPATILTESLAKFHNLEHRAAAIPVKRLGTLEELAATVVFLASRQAGFVTGQIIQVDGGMTASLC